MCNLGTPNVAGLREEKGVGTEDLLLHCVQVQELAGVMTNANVLPTFLTMWDTFTNKQGQNLVLEMLPCLKYHVYYYKKQTC